VVLTVPQGLKQTTTHWQRHICTATATEVNSQFFRS